MFTDPAVDGAGLSAAEISVLFIIWSLTSLLAEVPSGMLADRVSRRRVLTVGPLLTGSGFALWTAMPSLVSFAAGFVLWGVGASMRSGAMEALIYDELVAEGRPAHYPRMAGLVRAAAGVGVIAGTAAAVPLLAWGGYAAAGAASVGACVVCAAASAMLPESRTAADLESFSKAQRREGGWVDAARGGVESSVVIARDALVQIRAHRSIRSLLVLVVVLTWVVALDEYLPLLVESFLQQHDQTSRPEPATIAMGMLVIGVGDICGGLAARRRVGMRTVAVGLGVAAVTLIVAAMWVSPAAVLLVSVAFGIFGWSMVMADAALQARLESSSRATVTSVAGAGEEVVAIVAFAGWAAGATWLTPTTLFALAAVPYLAVSVLLWRSSSVGATTSRAARR